MYARAMAQIIYGEQAQFEGETIEFSTTVTFAKDAVTDTVRMFARDDQGNMFLLSEWPEPSWKNVLTNIRNSP